MTINGIELTEEQERAVIDALSGWVTCSLMAVVEN